MKYIAAIFTAITLLFTTIWGFFTKPKQPEPPVTGKPVIYLYPTKAMTVDVKLKTIGARFIATEPEYGSGWRVLAQPNGTLRNLADGKDYPYLFWETTNLDGWPMFSDGFLVKRKDLEPFLREKLAYLGLLPVEYEEFIEYWLPILRPNRYTLIHFAGEEYTSRYPMTVTPKPDSLLRVHLVYKAATGRERIAPQTLRPFQRKGFAVVEWGGTVLDS